MKEVSPFPRTATSATTPGPVFVVGASRSGTTLMGRILGRHPEVFTLDEIHFFEQLWTPDDDAKALAREEAIDLAERLLGIQAHGYLTPGSPRGPREEAERVVSAAKYETPTSAEVFAAFLRHESAKYGKKIPCDQTPRNVFYIGEILELFPEARVVNMIRDPRDVLLSQKRKWRRRFLGAGSIPLREAVRARINYHPVTISRLWTASIRAAERFADDRRLCSVYFEALLRDPEETVRRVCGTIGISFTVDMLDIPQAGSSSGRDDHGKRGVNPARAGSWRAGGLNPAEIYICQRMTRAEGNRHGYVGRPVGAAPISLAYYAVSFPLKFVVASFANLKRMRNITDTFKRRLT